MSNFNPVFSELLVLQFLNSEFKQSLLKIFRFHIFKLQILFAEIADKSFDYLLIRVIMNHLINNLPLNWIRWDINDRLLRK